MTAASDTARPGPQQVASSASSPATTTATAIAAATAAAARNHAWNSQTGAWSSSSFVEDPSTNTVWGRSRPARGTHHALHCTMERATPTYDNALGGAAAAHQLAEWRAATAAFRRRPLYDGHAATHCQTGRDVPGQIRQNRPCIHNAHTQYIQCTCLPSTHPLRFRTVSPSPLPRGRHPLSHPHHSTPPCLTPTNTHPLITTAATLRPPTNPHPPPHPTPPTATPPHPHLD